MGEKLVFNMSASAINTYNESQLVFYYQQIEKADSDTQVPTCYGEAGNVVHETIEEHQKSDPTQLFMTKWDERNLDQKLGLNGRPLSKEQYYYCMLRGIELLQTQYPGEIETEELIQFRLVNTDQAQVNIKGFIDCKVTVSKDEVLLVDWKTNSSVKSGSAFELQGKMYALLIYLKYGFVPKKVVFEYLKLKQNQEFIFTKEEVLDHYKYICSLAREIIAKGRDIEQYELGNIDSPFNDHKKKCLIEIDRRFSDPQLRRNPSEAVKSYSS